MIWSDAGEIGLSTPVRSSDAMPSHVDAGLRYRERMSRSSRRRMIRLRAVLQHIEPAAWRTIDVDARLPLATLHRVLQVSFGWHDSHLHRFREDDPDAVSTGIPRIGRRPRAWVDAWSAEETGDESDADVTVGEVFLDGGPLWYEYDLGDHWVHRLDYVDEDDARIGEAPAVLVGGEGRAPYEDSGGAPGWAGLRDVLNDQGHPDHDDVAGWAASAVGMWGTTDLDDADIAATRTEVSAMFRGTDMSGLIGVVPGVATDGPIVELAAELDVPTRSNLRRHLFRTDVLAETPLDGSLVAPYAWLLARIGEGLDLTAAGWLPPMVVREGMTACGWDDEISGAANREEWAVPMRRLRETATRMRLIRTVKGRLTVTAGARRALVDDAALTALIARMLLRQRLDDVERLGGTLLVLGIADGTVSTRQDAERLVLTGLGQLGFSTPEGPSANPRWYLAATRNVEDVLATLGLRGIDHRDRAPTAALRNFAGAALR